MRNPWREELAVIQTIETARGGEAGRGAWLLLAGAAALLFWGMVYLALS